ncbi:hypothetical protein ACP4OV_021197 [Aristida adscensionis]
MAREGGGGGSPAAERRRRVALRALLAGGEAASSSSSTVAAADARPSKGLLLRGLGCTSAAALEAHAPGAAAADSWRVSADWRGLGCTSSSAAAATVSQPHAPAAAAVDGADWRGRRRRRGKERRRARGGGGVVSGAGDVWCAPGIPFAAEASSVDCVVAPHQSAVGTRRRAQAERPHRERPAAPPARRVTMREHMSSSFMDSPPHHDVLFTDGDRIPSGHTRHTGGHRHSHIRLEEEWKWLAELFPYHLTINQLGAMMMLRARLLLGRMGVYDQYQDWRLDVDNMTYEELLDLEDRIGYVSTGLREDEIVRSVKMVKYSAFNHNHFSTEMDRKCSICQEEFEANEETGKLSCGHNYHVHCIKQWLSRKNACPVCKTAVSKT